MIARWNVLIACLMAGSLTAQMSTLTGLVTTGNEPLPYASVYLEGTPFGALTDSCGEYIVPLIPPGTYTLKIAANGYETFIQRLTLTAQENRTLNAELNPIRELEEIVVSGTLREVRRSESPVPVEVYTPAFFRKNPSPSVFDALQTVNGVRPQLNCNICNTGDIHINGLEGPYTMVLIDGMPVVSSLSTVYGLSGIPAGLIERVEIVRGPASSLYGSEAVGGLINVITKSPGKAPLFSADVWTTSWRELNADLGFRSELTKKIQLLTGISYFRFDEVTDRNNDSFTDVTLQNRVSLFQKWNFRRKRKKEFSLMARYLYEDRWGGDVRWNRTFRGGDSIYGESIYTNRWELIGRYALPLKEKLILAFSYNRHAQNSRYGTVSFIASQQVAFAQLTWDKTVGKHNLLAGGALRHTWYDDNTPATFQADSLAPQNRASVTLLPGVFLQDELRFSEAQSLLLGLRCDYNSMHGTIFTPRIAYRWKPNAGNLLRANAGTGFRVVNLFTEDHAALTGAREVVIAEALRPERSYNVNIDWLRRFHREKWRVELQFNAFYTWFDNRITADYSTDPDKIIYRNLTGYAESRGINSSLDLEWGRNLSLHTGITLMDVSLVEQGQRRQQLLTEHFTATWSLTGRLPRLGLSVDYTGNLYSPMELPLLGPLDPRAQYSPWWSIQNLQLTYNGFKRFELYGGVKNLLNWTPARGNPFIIARTSDPFDKEVQYDANGQVLATADNPYALTFDPTYVYGPNQGIRFFMGFRVNIRGNSKTIGKTKAK